MTAERPHRRRPVAGALAGIVVGLSALALPACGAYETVTESFAPSIVLNCPESRVIADAVQFIDFGARPGRDLVDINYSGRIADVRLGCTSAIDKKTRVGTQDVEMMLIIDAERGPANRDRKAQFPYFIRIVANDGRIVWGEDFAVTIDFPDNRTRTRFSAEPVTVEVPVTRKWTNRSYVIYAGFKLSREQLEFNRSQGVQTGGRP